MVTATFWHRELANVKCTIELLEGLNLGTAKIQDIELDLSRLLELYLANFEEVQAEFVYRARPNEGTELYHNVSQLWYPLAEHKPPLNRANCPNGSVFYCSDSIETALIEQKINAPGSTYTLLKCERINREKYPVVLEIGVNDLTAKHNPRLGGNRANPRTTIRTKFRNDSDYQANEVIHRFLIREFTKNVTNDERCLYKISAATAKQVLAVSGVDGICYPSVQSHFKGVNIAFKTEAVDRLYRPVECSLIKVIDVVGSPGYEVEMRRTSRSITHGWDITW
jgi:RES domain